MTKKSASTEALAPVDLARLSPETLARAVAESLGPRVRKEITVEEIRATVSKLPYTDNRPSRPVPSLIVRKLLFKGTKTLVNQEPTSICYEQQFETGVNIILIEDNLVGKSSILKTIKFALTGDHGEYDAVVRGWIQEVWLQFSLDTRHFTVVLAEKEDAWHGALVSGQETRHFAQVLDELPRKDHHWIGLERIQEGLAGFFFREYSLASLGWTRAKGDGTSLPQMASWQTYFQALRIRDDDHAYLLCEPIPGKAPQEPILFTTFLGLHLAEQLNQLGIQGSTLKKAKQYSEAERERLNKEREHLAQERRSAGQRLEEIKQQQVHRQETLTRGDIPAQIISANNERIQNATQIAELGRELQDLASRAQRERAQARRIRSLAELQREFTGLDVTICPRCAKDIDASLVIRETETHECRLCSKVADAASPEEVESLEVEAQECDHRAQVHQRGQTEVGRKIAALRGQEDQLSQRIEVLQQAIQTGLTSALPSPEEEEEKRQLSETIGKIAHQIWLITEKLGGEANGGSNLDKQAKIIKHIRDTLQQEADRRNSAINVRLNELARKVIADLGATQITGVRCSPLGYISFEKNGEEISFGGIKNPGERFRVKLALLLAIMRLGPQGGRHPGFLLIDQLGAAEMVPEDLRASAQALRHIEDAFEGQVQLICCTTRPEFRDATDNAKIYGAKAKGPDGKLFAF